IPSADQPPSEGEGLTIHFKKPANWGTPQLYYYETDPQVSEPSWNTAPSMASEGNQWYVYTIQNTDSARIMFKDSNGNQIPGPMEPGFLRTEEGWYDGVWHQQHPGT